MGNVKNALNENDLSKNYFLKALNLINLLLNHAP